MVASDCKGEYPYKARHYCKTPAFLFRAKFRDEGRMASGVERHDYTNCPPARKQAEKGLHFQILEFWNGNPQTASLLPRIRTTYKAAISLMDVNAPPDASVDPSLL